MKYLLSGMESQERIYLLLKFTSIRSQELKQALNAHLVDGLPAIRSAARFGITNGNFTRALNRLESAAKTVEQIKELDFYKNSYQKSDNKKGLKNGIKII